MPAFLHPARVSVSAALRFNTFLSTPISSPRTSPITPFRTVRAMATRIPPPAVRDQLNAETPPLYIDVRTPKEYAEGHVPNAVNVPVTLGAGVVVPSFVDDVKAVSEGHTLILGCKSGKRSSMAIDLLQKAGFEHLIEMQGGFEAWLASHLPVER